MTKICLEIGKPVDWNEKDKYTFASVTDWCEDCFLDKNMYKCHIAIGRPDVVYLDDDIKYIRPAECKKLEVKKDK